MKPVLLAAGLALLPAGYGAGLPAVAAPATAVPAPAIVREGAMEKMPLFGGETAKEWGVPECSMEPSTERVKATKCSLRWHVPVDHTTGEPKYPIGWPRTNHAIPEGPLREWAAWDFLHLWVYVDTTREALPKDVAGLGITLPDRGGKYNRTLTELKKGEWVELNIPIAQITDSGAQAIQFHVTESNYRHGDQVDFFIDDLALTRYAEPVLLDFAAESAVMFAGAPGLPVRFRLSGVKPGEAVEVTCEVRAGGKTAARVAVQAQRGAQRVALRLPAKALPAGAYELVARVAGGQTPATARVRLVESPWR